MIKNVTSFIIILFLSQYALAKVIELDNQNSTHCQMQLGNGLDNASWVNNVVMLYVKDSPEIDKLRNIYEQVSTEHPKRNLFALNVYDPKADAKKNQLIMKTVKACLTDMMYAGEEFMGTINDKTSPVLLYDYAHATVGFENHELSTKQDFLEFIGEKTPVKPL